MKASNEIFLENVFHYISISMEDDDYEEEKGNYATLLFCYERKVFNSFCTTLEA